jgi:hypothetical protein
VQLFWVHRQVSKPAIAQERMSGYIQRHICDPANSRGHHMYRHAYFDLLLHTDDELEALLQIPIVERATLHEWPLSCVQRLTTGDGRRLVYKTQYGPFVEAEFYAKARSELLVSARTMHQSDGYVVMLIEYVAAPTLADRVLGEQATVNIGRDILDRIAAIEGELPVFLDVGTEEKWQTQIDTTLRNLSRLVSTGQFSIVDTPVIRHLEQWAASKVVRSALRIRPGYVHGDLGADNVFLLSDEFRVIDWQKTKKGPTGLDLATLLESKAIEPLGYVDRGVVWIMYLLRIRWLTECAVRWFPAGIGTYDASIAQLADKIGQAQTS